MNMRTRRRAANLLTIARFRRCLWCPRRWPSMRLSPRDQQFFAVALEDARREHDADLLVRWRDRLAERQVRVDIDTV